TTQDLTVIVTQDEPAVITPEEVNDGSTDNCGELIFSLDRDTFDKPGVYEVVLTATDASGNTSQATATITVKREGADPKQAHVVPTMLTRTSIAKVILPFNGRISEVHVMETETNNYKVFEGNKKNTMQIDIAPMKGTLLVKIIDAEGNVYMKKLIAL
ncbi:PKD domain-containing protein, partial [Gillisia marina]|uniref:PKD domain-containing protein n=1 Tax=Gillisia marina TaxID=1167637 RepID=UPI00029A63D6